MSKKVEEYERSSLDSQSEDDMDPNQYLDLDNGKELDFDIVGPAMSEHTFEEDFSKELDDLDEDDTESGEDVGLLDRDDLDLVEMDLEYQSWLNEGGKG